MKISELAPWLAIAITLILSILIPLFTQIANNRFQLKLKQMDIQQAEKDKKLSAYENYFQKVGGCVLYAQKNNISDAGASVQRLYIYLPQEKWNDLDKLFDHIKEYEWDDAKKYMKSVSKWIAEDMKMNSEKL